jgi:MFS transporter, ACS family, hexuronate transporter
MAQAPTHTRPLRWQIIGLILVATTINYIDRDSISVAEIPIRKEFGLSPQDYGNILFWFFLAYAVMQVVSGRVIDRIGARLGFTISIIWWSIAAMLHGLAGGAASLATYRFLLGVGEAGNYPAALKVIAEWFPKTERTKAVGILNAGPGLGSILAKPLMAFLILTVGWRWSFVVTGALGLFWLLAWQRVYYPPDQHPRIGEAEARLIQEGRVPGGGEKLPWLAFFRYREIWGLMLSRFVADGAFYFLVLWLPKYLNEARGFDLKQIGMFGWIPPLAADLGAIAGGWMGAALITRGYSINASRKIMIWTGALLIPVVMFAARVESAYAALGLIAAAMFFTQVKSTSLFTVPADLFQSRNVAAAWGLSGAAGSFGAMLFQSVVGYLVKHHGYAPVFLIVPFLHLASAAIVMLLIRRIEPLNE